MLPSDGCGDTNASEVGISVGGWGILQKMCDITRFLQNALSLNASISLPLQCCHAASVSHVDRVSAGLRGISGASSSPENGLLLWPTNFTIFPRRRMLLLRRRRLLEVVPRWSLVLHRPLSYSWNETATRGRRRRCTSGAAGRPWFIDARPSTTPVLG